MRVVIFYSSIPIAIELHFLGYKRSLIFTDCLADFVNKKTRKFAGNLYSGKLFKKGLGIFPKKITSDENSHFHHMLAHHALGHK